VTDAGTASQAGILIVDDDAANLAALEAVLAPLGQRLVRADSGREALRHLLRERFAVILLDVRMRDMDGFEVAGLIRARPSTQGTPIIFVTAFQEAEESMRRAYRLGAADFIFKPYAPDFLRAKVGVFVELYHRERAISDLLIQAQEASRVKSEFLNMAAHELRTPLSVIIGYLSMLSDGTLGEHPPRWGRALEMLNTKAAELNKIVEDLLAAARLASGAFPEQAGPCDLRQLAGEAVQRTKARAELLDAEVSVEVPADPVPAHADPVHVSRILDNLLNNALTYARGRPWVRVGVTRTAGEAVVEVEDHGIGIPAQVRERIFERFFRANDPQLPPHPGTGLGLYISRELASRHHGRLAVVASTPGRGSIVALTLPLVNPTPAPSPNAASPRSGDGVRPPGR
jgi:two-component system, sensor histidine kinase